MGADLEFHKVQMLEFAFTFLPLNQAQEIFLQILSLWKRLEKGAKDHQQAKDLYGICYSL